MRLSSMLCWTAVVMRSRRSEERPTDSGFALGNSWAKTQGRKNTVASREAVKMRERISVRRRRTSSKFGASLQSEALISHEANHFFTISIS
jgi:hypothetical protein